MKKLSILAAVLAVASSSVFASDQTVNFNGSGVASFASTAVAGPVLFGGDDNITFQGVSPGLYDFSLTMSGQYLTLTSATLNGQSGTLVDTGKWTFLGIDGTSSSNFVLALKGTTDGPQAVYSGELTVSSVPEPESYALFLGGLCAMGFLVRRRNS